VRSALPLLQSDVSLYCALQIIRAAAERGETTLFFCKVGKDRTGLTAALVLAACGATKDEIISDYNRCFNFAGEFSEGGAFEPMYLPVCA